MVRQSREVRLKPVTAIRYTRSPTSPNSRRRSEAHMYRREVEINGTPLSFETGKLAKQADGSVLVRMGDSVVLVTACAAANAARGHRLSSADGRLQGIHLRIGAHSGRVLQARRQAVGKGSADQPRHRPADPAAVSRRAGATNRRSSRWCCRPTRTTTRTCSR